MRKYLFNTAKYFEKSDDQGNDPEAARKAEIQKQRDSIKVDSVTIEDDDEKEVKADEQEKEDGEKEASEDDAEKEVEEGDEIEEKEEDKEEIKAAKKAERLEKKYNRTADKLKDREKRIRELEAKLAADPDKANSVTSDEVKAQAKKEFEEEQLVKERNRTAEKIGEDAQKLLKLNDKQWNALVAEVVEELGFTPYAVIEAVSELDNGAAVIAHLFKNVDEAEEIYKLKGSPTKLGVAIVKLSAKLAAKPQKKISQVPDAPEALGGKSAGGDRLAILASKKNLTSSEMAEYVQQRNTQVAQARANGKHNLR